MELKAEGFNRDGDSVEIPSREWAHLKSFEERDRDVFKIDGLDGYEPYTKVRFPAGRSDAHLAQARDEVRHAEVNCRGWVVGTCANRRSHPEAKGAGLGRGLQQIPWPRGVGI